MGARRGGGVRVGESSGVAGGLKISILLMVERVRFCSNLLKNLATSIDSLLVTVLKYEDENYRFIMLAVTRS